MKNLDVSRSMYRKIYGLGFELFVVEILVRN